MARLICPRCKTVLKLDGVPPGGKIQCGACGAGIRVARPPAPAEAAQNIPVATPVPPQVMAIRDPVYHRPAPLPEKEALPVAIEVDPGRELSPDADVAPRRRRPRRGRRRSMGPGVWIAIVAGVVGAVVVMGIAVCAIIYLISPPTQYSWSLDKGKKADYHLRFTGGKKVELWVTSNRDTDVDLFVYDRQNRLVAVDEGDSKDCYVWFVPPETQAYRVEVQNRVRLEPFLQHRNGSNSGTLRYQESERGPQEPMGMAPRPPLPVPPVPPRLPGQGMGQHAPQVISLQPGASGAVHLGTLTPLDGRDARHGNAFCKIFTYPMTAGKQYVIDLKSTQFDAFLRLENAGGQQLAQDDDSGGGHDAQIVFMPPQDGTYRIIATTFAPGQVGNFTLTIRP